MKTKNIKIWFILMTIVLFSIACSLPNIIGNPIKNILGNQIDDITGEIEELVEDLPEVEDIPEVVEPEDIPEEAQEVIEQAEDALEGLITSITNNDTSMLDNYRTTFILDSEILGDSGKDMSQHVEMAEEVNQTQNLYHNNLYSTGSGENSFDSDLHIYVLGEETYLYDPSIPELPCILMAGGMENFDETTFLRPEDFFETIDALELVESGVTVNGVLSDHYKVKNTGIDMQDTYEEGGDIWVAQEDGYIVRYIGFADGEYSDGDKTGGGRTEWEYNLFDVGQVAIIDFPVECRDQQESVEDVPIPDNATNKEMIAGIITFETPDTPEQLGDFYREQLPAGGWKIVEDSTIAELVMMTAEKEGQSLQIMITVGDSAGSSIIITTIPLP